MIARNRDNRKVLTVLSRDDVHSTMKRRIGVTLDDSVDHILAVVVQCHGPAFRHHTSPFGFGQA